MREALEGLGSLSDWDAFASSWDRLELDLHMGDGGRYRRRRHATFVSVPGQALARAPHQPHHQSLAYNPLNGGIARWFEPVEKDVSEGASLQTILRYCRELFERLKPEVTRWHIEVHQFRIEASPKFHGQPTPEGVHRDGVNFVAVLLVRRRNIQSGTTVIYDADHRELGRFTLTEPLDAALLDDTRAFHGVTPVLPMAPALDATRDVLVVTWKAADPETPQRDY